VVDLYEVVFGRLRMLGFREGVAHRIALIEAEGRDPEMEEKLFGVA